MLHLTRRQDDWNTDDYNRNPAFLARALKTYVTCTYKQTSGLLDQRGKMNWIRYTNIHKTVSYFFCVRGTRTQLLICVRCSVHYWMSCAINKGFFSRLHLCQHTFAMKRLLTFCLTLMR